MASAGATREAVDGVLALAAEAGREDLVERLRVARARMMRPATIVCVVGDYKQGKSSLVNALVGRALCPVDDDMATSVLTLVRHGPDTTVSVRRKVGDQRTIEMVDVEGLRDWVTEAGNPGNERGVERVDIRAPSALLESGLVLVDTPGMGGLGAGQAAATLAFLPFADGLILVTDASSELSAHEAELLERATELCPTVLVAVTKTDLHTHWQRVADVDRQHVASLDGGRVPPPPIFTVSSMLHDVATRDRDVALDELSGIPHLVAALQGGVEIPAKAVAARRAIADASGALAQVAAAARAEVEALTDPDRMQASATAFENARERLEHLRGPAARWNIVVGDRVSDLNNDVSFRFRGALRSTTRTIDDDIESLDTAQEWDELARRLQTMVADAVADAFAAIERGRVAIRAEVAELLAEETADLPALGAERAPSDPTELWTPKEIDPPSGRLSSTLSGLRGAQSGILMFGMMSGFMPGGIAAFLALAPVTLGIGAAFAGIQLFDAHKRKVQQRRAAARANLRQFLDDVQFEVGNEFGNALRDVQRSIRDEFTARIVELQRTYTDMANQAQGALRSTETARAERLPVLHALLEQADRLDEVLAGVEAAR